MSATWLHTIAPTPSVCLCSTSSACSWHKCCPALQCMKVHLQCSNSSRTVHPSSTVMHVWTPCLMPPPWFKSYCCGLVATATTAINTLLLPLLLPPQVQPSAKGARNFSQCDSMLIGDRAGANTYPYIQVRPYFGCTIVVLFGPGLRLSTYFCGFSRLGSGIVVPCVFPLACCGGKALHASVESCPKINPQVRQPSATVGRVTTIKFELQLIQTTISNHTLRPSHGPSVEPFLRRATFEQAWYGN